MRRRPASVLVAVLCGLVAGIGLGAAPAQAAACPAGRGVTVVVGSQVGCDPSAGGDAASNFTDAGHTLTYARREPGFVCRVDGQPASDPCVNASPASAYWGLFWSDGASGTWVYSSLGVGSLTVPAGGSVAFVFQTGGGRTMPSVAPPRASAPSPTVEPTSNTNGGSKGKGSKGDRKKTGGTSVPPAAGSTPGPSASPSVSASPTASEPSSSTSTTTTAPPTAADTSAGDATVAGGVTPTSAEADQSDGGRAAGWIAGGAVVVVLGVAGVVAWRRRAA